MTNSEAGRKAFEDANAALTANLADNPATSYNSFADYKHGFFDGFLASRTQYLAVLEEMKRAFHEALKLADTLVPVLRNMLNEHGQMLQQHHTKGDEDFLISKTITAIDTALKSGEQDTPRTENSTGARTQQLTEPLHAETVSNEYGENVTSAEHDEWSPPLRPEGTEAGKDFTFGFTTSEPVKVDVPTEEMCDAARLFILARDSNIHTWGGLSRCIDTTIPYIAEKMRNDPQGHITKWDFADCVYRLMQSVATPNQVKVSAMQERGGVERESGGDV